MPVSVDVDVALERLKVIEDYDPGSGPQPCVHTFRTGTGMMLGAHWSVEKARAAFEEHGVEEIEPFLGHGLRVVDRTGPVLFETA